MEQEDDDKIDPLVSGYETNLEMFPDDFSSYELEVWSTPLGTSVLLTILYLVPSVRLYVRPRINQQSGCEWMSMPSLPSANVY
ncbi:hypothetical protein Y032_0007g3243 [Ancylostoma ceylanicum]|uniref:Uncharacterized protein n=1 Tax=Ancylostoma ceylanicum TaxID=53326 RepID=A0A016VME3_9BILA|nr:hypothetical protein Y032_0007g3243 [Ancylostoma ceylanicum]